MGGGRGGQGGQGLLEHIRGHVGRAIRMGAWRVLARGCDAHGSRRRCRWGRAAGRMYVLWQSGAVGSVDITNEGTKSAFSRSDTHCNIRQTKTLDMGIYERPRYSHTARIMHGLAPLCPLFADHGHCGSRNGHLLRGANNVGFRLAVSLTYTISGR